MATKKESTQKSSDKESNDPCWDGYKKEGMKTKGGKKVPNCVPDKQSHYFFNSINLIKMETYENEEANQMGNSSIQQTDPRTQQDNAENDMMSLRSSNTNEDGEEDMDDETMIDNEMDDDEMQKEDSMGTGGEMSREDDM